MDLKEIVLASTTTQLTQSLYEGSALNVSKSSTKL